MDFDDHDYCETCGKHSATCWCELVYDVDEHEACQTPDAHEGAP